MGQITLRGIPEEIERLARKEAQERGISLNRAILSLLERAATAMPKKVGQRKRSRRHDLDRFCGIWSQAEADEFDALLADQREIDEELWNKAG